MRVRLLAIAWFLWCGLAAGCAPPPNPIIEGRRVTLFVESATGDPPSITGDFTGWEPRPAKQVRRSRWFQFDTTLENDARVEYLVSYGAGDFRLDARNPRRVPSVGGEASEIAMPDAESHPETDDSVSGVGFERTFFDFQVEDGRTRRVDVFAPPRREGDDPLPVVYFHDGALMIEKGVPEILGRLLAAGRIRPFVSVFVNPASRADDYKADAVFREWFVREVVPFAERSGPPPSRAVIGVSRGAIAAIDLALHHPDLFSGCGLLIPSTYPTNLTAQIARADAKPVRFAIVTARYDARWLSEGRDLQEALNGRGYEVSYREVPEGHNVQTWRAHLDDVLTGLGFGKS